MHFWVHNYITYLAVMTGAGPIYDQRSVPAVDYESLLRNFLDGKLADNASPAPRLGGETPCCCRSPDRPIYWGSPWAGFHHCGWWLAT